MELFLGGPAGVSHNLLLSARLIARAALLREESIGSHFREDFPERGEGSPRHSVLTLNGGQLVPD
jgi:aspartate oxidase